jgi:hypothetical protein
MKRVTVLRPFSASISGKKSFARVSVAYPTLHPNPSMGLRTYLSLPRSGRADQTFKLTKLWRITKLMKLISLVLSILFLSLANQIVHAQACCATSPTSETTTYIQPETGNLATESAFRQVLQGGSYSSWTITEMEGAQGADSCWNSNVDPAYVPEYPSVAGSTWVVAADNSWYPDDVGWTVASVAYIRQNSPLQSNTPIIPNFPCGFQLYQDLFIVCPGGTSPGEDYDNTILTGAVYSTYVQNVREGVGSVINQ